MTTDFGRRLKEARKYAKLTQKELARRVGISQGTLSELEIKAHGSSFTPQLAAQCGVNPQWLANGEGNPLDGGASTRAPIVAERMAGTYGAAAPETPVAIVNGLGNLLRAHTATRQRTIADILARYALDPSNDELADELAAQLQAPPRSSAGKRSAM